MSRFVAGLVVLSTIAVACSTPSTKTPQSSPMIASPTHAKTSPASFPSIISNPAYVHPTPDPFVASAPATCDLALAKEKAYATGDAMPHFEGACASANSVLATLRQAAFDSDFGARWKTTLALKALSTCDRLPPLVPDLLNADLMDSACGEALLTEPLKTFAQASLENQQGARALIAASRIARVRASGGNFQALDDPRPAGSTATLLKPWIDMLTKLDHEAIAEANGAPPEIAAETHFLVAHAWLAFVDNVRSVYVRDEAVKQEIEEVTKPIDARVVELTKLAFAIGQKGGVFVREQGWFKKIAEAHPELAVKPTRDLDFLRGQTDLSSGPQYDAGIIVSRFPSWASYALLEKAAPSMLSQPSVLTTFACENGVPTVLRAQLEKGPLNESQKTPIALSLAKVAVQYDSVVDCVTVAAWSNAKTPLARLAVGICKAFRRDGAAIYVTDLKELDAVSKIKNPFVHYDAAATFNGAMLAVDALLAGPENPSDAAMQAARKKALDAAMKRLESVQQVDEMDPGRAHAAKDMLVKLRGFGPSSTEDF